MNTLKCDNIKFKYPGMELVRNQEWFINISSITFNSGDVYLLCGENMSGKSTLVKLITGSMPYYPKSFFAGDLSVGSLKYSFPIKPGIVRNLGIGAVHQLDPMFPELSIWQNIELGKPKHYKYGNNKKNIKNKIKKIIKKFSTEKDVSIYNPLGELSGGTKSICRILRIILWDYKFIFLDEPTINLDTKNYKLAFELLNYAKKKDTTYILISFNKNDHDIFKKHAADWECKIESITLENGKLIKNDENK